ncbi:MAG: hypothetical protein QM536_03530 [Chitinophagaceae bacterium]|nr:hypothetical protein [Chitinophagaceae bacterium]
MFKLSLLSLFFATGCFYKCPIEGIDLEKWKKDKMGCLGKRGYFLDTLIAQKESLKRLYERDITYIFGRPDKQELYTRGQKVFIYYIYSADNCSLQKKNITLEIKFNSIGLTNEIFVREL